MKREPAGTGVPKTAMHQRRPGRMSTIKVETGITPPTLPPTSTTSLCRLPYLPVHCALRVCHRHRPVPLRWSLRTTSRTSRKLHGRDLQNGASLNPRQPVALAPLCKHAQARHRKFRNRGKQHTPRIYEKSRFQLAFLPRACVALNPHSHAAYSGP